jgi:hypothetical protein
MKVVTQYLIGTIHRQKDTRDSIEVRKLEVSRLQGRFLKKITNENQLPVSFDHMFITARILHFSLQSEYNFALNPSNDQLAAQSTLKS